MDKKQRDEMRDILAKVTTYDKMCCSGEIFFLIDSAMPDLLDALDEAESAVKREESVNINWFCKHEENDSHSEPCVDRVSIFRRFDSFG